MFLSGKMQSSTSKPSHSRSHTPLNAEAASADSRQGLLPTQGQFIFILNPILILSSYNNNVFNNTVVGAALPLHSLPLPTMNSATQNGNVHQSSQEFLPLTTRKEEPVDLDGIEIPLSFMHAYNYQAMAQNAIQTGCFQLSVQQHARNKEKTNMNVEIARLSNKCNLLEEENNDLENLLAGERKECLNKQQELDDRNVKLDEMKKEAKLQESYLQKERVDGNAKGMKIEDQKKTIAEMKRKLEETDKELQEAKDTIRKIVDEYFDSITRPTTLNKLLSELLAKNPIEISSRFQMSTLLANTVLERFQSQENNPIIPGTSTNKGDVALKSKKRKHEDDN